MTSAFHPGLVVVVVPSPRGLSSSVDPKKPFVAVGMLRRPISPLGESSGLPPFGLGQGVQRMSWNEKRMKKQKGGFAVCYAVGLLTLRNVQWVSCVSEVGTQEGAIISVLIAVYLGYHHFSRTVLERAFDQGSVVATIAVICITAASLLLVL